MLIRSEIEMNKNSTMRRNEMTYNLVADVKGLFVMLLTSLLCICSLIVCLEGHVKRAASFNNVGYYCTSL